MILSVQNHDLKDGRQRAEKSLDPYFSEKPAAALFIVAKLKEIAGGVGYSEISQPRLADICFPIAGHARYLVDFATPAKTAGLERVAFEQRDYIDFLFKILIHC